MANKIGTQLEQDRAREAGNVRREKRGGMRVNFVLLLASLLVVNIIFSSYHQWLIDLKSHKRKTLWAAAISQLYVYLWILCKVKERGFILTKVDSTVKEQNCLITLCHEENVVMIK